MLTKEELIDLLAHCVGGDEYYRYSLGMLYTDGVKELADHAECYWLLDAIAVHQPKLRQNPRLRDFQLWLLVVGNEHELIKPKHSAVLTCWEDTPVLGVKPAVSQEIEYTDFPLPEMKLYVEFIFCDAL